MCGKLKLHTTHRSTWDDRHLLRSIYNILHRANKFTSAQLVVLVTNIKFDVLVQSWFSVPPYLCVRTIDCVHCAPWVVCHVFMEYEIAHVLARIQICNGSYFTIYETWCHKRSRYISKYWTEEKKKRKKEKRTWIYSE